MPKQKLTNKQRAQRYRALRKLGMPPQKAVLCRDYGRQAYRDLIIMLKDMYRAGYLP